MTKVVVIGAGAWGTALASAFQKAENIVSLYTIEKDVATQINADHENKKRLPGVKLSPAIRATLKPACLKDAHIVVLAQPAQATREVVTKLKPFIGKDSYIIVGSKGIEGSTGELLSSVIASILPEQPIAVLSGPAFALPLAQHRATACTLASARISASRWLASTLSSKTFRLYPTDDMIGCQLGGALKNVIAIASGITEGAAMGENARAAIITRGLHEIARLGVIMGGRTETLMGLSGLGDMILTAASHTSRNFQLGYAIGQGESIAELMQDATITREGIFTVKAAHILKQKYDVDMPILETMHMILYDGASVQKAYDALLNRPLRTEERA
ncbi:MAG: NAD(P)-dependent glycerol-3-phosphate dehydrogenase [Alphaproteobacteria bacterium]|nr:MAG: NAD(P)-dependent glycerol-3-phosphate dehydrogenase [Alphaproteobacteria bacterium]